MLAQLLNADGDELDTVDLFSQDAAWKYIERNWRGRMTAGCQLVVVVIYTLH